MKPPRDPKTGEELPPRAQPGYYPGYSTLAQKDHWDKSTQNTVLKRVEKKSELRFFKEDEARVLEAALDVVMPQSDRNEAHRIPVLAAIDERLHLRKFDGTIFEGMPEEDEAYRLGLAGIARLARAIYERSFEELRTLEREELLLSLRDDQPKAALEIWQIMPGSHFWKLLVQDAAAAYYAHPYAWDEIGFGGPAYPRGYMRLDGKPEPWEKDERRYEWLAPEDSRSDALTPNQTLFPEGTRHGEDGTH